VSEAIATTLRALERRALGFLELLCSVLLVAMVVVTVYTVVMRYVFRNPPFWGDTLTMFCNIWLVLIAYAVSVRKREFIAMQGVYAMLPAGWPFALNFAWNMMTTVFGALLAVYGASAVANVPGSYWELGGLPNSVPLSIVPLAGVLILTAGLRNLGEDIAMHRRRRERAETVA
jgi:TRAP-type C4-dicarboxylate transport system permease small subunit